MFVYTVHILTVFVDGEFPHKNRACPGCIGCRADAAFYFRLVWTEILLRKTKNPCWEGKGDDIRRSQQITAAAWCQEIHEMERAWWEEGMAVPQAPGREDQGIWGAGAGGSQGRASGTSRPATGGKQCWYSTWHQVGHITVQHMASGRTHNSTAHGTRWVPVQYSTWHQVGHITVQHMASCGTHNSTSHGTRWDTVQYSIWHQVGHSIQYTAFGKQYSMW